MQKTQRISVNFVRHFVNFVFKTLVMIYLDICDDKQTQKKTSTPSKEATGA